MMSLTSYLAYVAACIVLVIVPGPTVTVIIANSLRHGARAGLMNVAGTQVGLAIMLAVLTAGLASIMAAMDTVFGVLRLLGAAYLVWLGIKLWRSDGTLGGAAERARPGGSFFWQGFIVIITNPKVLLLFGALIPQFLNPAGNLVSQTLALGVTFMVVATILDSLYALLAGTAGGWLSQKNVRLVERISGTCLIAGGLWLALTARH